MFIVFSSTSDIFQHASYMQTSMPADTHNPFLIPVFPVSSTTVLYVLNGLPLQFIVMWENICGVRFHSICSCLDGSGILLCRGGIHRRISAALSSTIWHGINWVLDHLLQLLVFWRLGNASFQAGSTILIDSTANSQHHDRHRRWPIPRFPFISYTS